MEDFNDKWWPLVLNIWTKWDSSLVEIEADKNYSPPAITSAIKEYATLELGLGECARELRCKEVANIKYKVHGPTEAHLIGNVDLRLDISESISFLTEQGYRVKSYRISQRSTKDIVFAHSEQLKKLERHRWLTLMDSTHKTNRYDWRLFTLYVRNTYRCWNVGAHFFVSSEDADTVAEALTIIRNKCYHWSPVTYFLIRVISKPRALQRVFPAWPLVSKSARTKIGCESLIQDAINHCSVPSIQNYIKRNYAKNTEKWGLWARQHSPLLLQVTSTNSIESFHSKLEKVISSLYGLIGAVHGIVNIDCKKRSKAESASFDFLSKKVFTYDVDDDILEEIQKFPFPF
ncbi:hypothetical protein GLOIN_2v1481403 [Rhizophagus clarus]|uniref:ZSWIM1/3 RNaseH-like domain-containing protein n=1 Tax=Rhizophagus clarus TaxID=94130 RepID=A0A8H3L498_9GLOM|nr:hypothetical protein GLOIN_2v1481403 [Rhizophagus clarus]